MATDTKSRFRLRGRLSAEWVIISALLAILVLAVLAVRSATATGPATAVSASDTSSPAPAPITDPGVPRVRVDIAPQASGDVRVTEVVSSPTPLARLDIRLPPPSFSRAFSVTTRVIDLEVAVGDRRIPASFPAARGRTTIKLPVPSTEVRLTYVLLGATKQRRAAPEGRAQVQVRPLTYRLGAGDGLVTTTVDDVVVHNLVCPDLPVDEQLCGRESATGWETTPLPVRSSTVLAQVDLPVD